MIILRTPQPFLPSEDERKGRDKMIFDKKVFELKFQSFKYSYFYVDKDATYRVYTLDITTLFIRRKL